MGVETQFQFFNWVSVLRCINWSRVFSGFSKPQVL